MGKHLVLAGAGHAHMVLLDQMSKIIERGHKVSVIGPSPVHYYSGMGPGMLGGTYSAEDIRFSSRNDVERRGGEFIEDAVVRIEPAAREVILGSGKRVTFDILSCNLGSSVTHFSERPAEGSVFTVKPIHNLLEARNRIIKCGKNEKLRIAVIGGGPSGVEIAGNLVQLALEEKLIFPEIFLYARSSLMSGFTERVQRVCLQYLRNQGVEIYENKPVTGLENGSILLEKEQKKDVDVVFVASGIQPSRVFAESGIACGPDGGMLVNEFLQCVDYPEIFGGGDCIHFQPQPLDKVGVYAVRQNPVLFSNVMSFLEGKPLQPFTPGGKYLLIFNLGCGYGVLEKGFLFFKGRLAFKIKDFIDRRFIRSFKN